MNNKQYLRDKMKEYNYRHEDMANLLGVSKSAIKSWLLREDSKTSRTFTDIMANRLKNKLRSRKPYAKKKCIRKK